MLKIDTVLGLLHSLENTLSLLKPLRDESLGQLTTDLVRYHGVLHLLQVSIQHVTDIGAHILAAGPLATPGDYREVILEMGRHKIIPYDFAQKISPMAALRNILVHEYLTVDPARVYEILQNRLDDFEQFIEYIYDYLDCHGYLSDRSTRSTFLHPNEEFNV